MDSMDNMMSLDTYIYIRYTRYPGDPVCAAFQGIRCAPPSGGSVCAALVEQCQPEQGAPSGQRATHIVSAKKKKVVRPVGNECGQIPDQEEVILCFYNFYNVNNFLMFF